MIVIRQAVSTDVETIAHFNIALCRETEGWERDPVTVTNGVRRFVSEPNMGRYFVAEIDGEVVGQTAHTFEWSGKTKPPAKATNASASEKRVMWFASFCFP